MQRTNAALLPGEFKLGPSRIYSVRFESIIDTVDNNDYKNNVDKKYVLIVWVQIRTISWAHDVAFALGRFTGSIFRTFPCFTRASRAT